MLKRLIVPIALAALALPAAASPELAESWGARAAALYTESVGYLDTARTGEAPALPDHYLIDLERFSATATRLGTWNDQVSGAKDLGCIFRGMAEEAEVQLTALEAAKSADASETALKRLATNLLLRLISDRHRDRHLIERLVAVDNGQQQRVEAVLQQRCIPHAQLAARHWRLATLE